MTVSTACGCTAGICLMNGREIQACDDCALFETDEDAASVLEPLLQLLDQEHKRGGAVADALDRLTASTARRGGAS